MDIVQINTIIAVVIAFETAILVKLPMHGRKLIETTGKIAENPINVVEG